jgi:ADP-ribose pyrophosphatase YjhB (NUDIX family)
MNNFGSVIKVKNNDKYVYLLVKGKYTGKWSFPKGHIEKDERPLECAIRETKEETGIDLNGIKPEKCMSGYFGFTLAAIPETKIIDTNEIEETKWMTIEEMQLIDGNRDVKFFVKKSLKSSNTFFNDKEGKPEKQSEKIYCSWANMIKGKEEKPEIQPDPEKEFLDYYNDTASKHQYYQDRDMQLWYIIKMAY